MQMFNFLLCFALRNAYEKLERSLKEGKDTFTARNENQVFSAKTLAIIFIEVRFHHCVNRVGRFLILYFMACLRGKLLSVSSDESMKI